jgi:hypothetical protein
VVARSHPLDTPAQVLLPALRAVRPPYGFSVKRGAKRRTRTTPALTERDRSE